MTQMEELNGHGLDFEPGPSEPVVPPDVAERARKKWGVDVGLMALGIGDETVVLRVITYPEMQRYLDMNTDQKKRRQAMEELVRTSCIYPDRAGLDSLLRKKPLLVVRLFEKAWELNGGDDELSVKKL